MVEVKLFLDANVLFTAAHNPAGKAALIVELQSRAKWALASSTYAIEEALRNLRLKAPGAVDRLDGIVKRVEVVQVVQHLPDLEYPAGLVEKDRPIFQAALGCGASHLLTGDLKHFGPFMGRPKQTSGMVVLTVAAFLASCTADEPDATVPKCRP